MTPPDDSAEAMPPPFDAPLPFYHRGWFVDLALSAVIAVVSMGVLHVSTSRSVLTILTTFVILPSLLRLPRWIWEIEPAIPIVFWFMLTMAQWFFLLHGTRRVIRPKTFAGHLVIVLLAALLYQVVLFWLVIGDLC